MSNFYSLKMKNLHFFTVLFRNVLHELGQCKPTKKLWLPQILPSNHRENSPETIYMKKKKEIGWIVLEKWG